MDRKYFEECAFISYGWKKDILFVRVEIPLSKIDGFEKKLLKGKVNFYSGGKVISKACFKVLHLIIVTSEIDEGDYLEPVKFLIKSSTMVYEACVDVPLEKCVKTDTTFKIKIGDMETNPITIAVPVL